MKRFLLLLWLSPVYGWACSNYINGDVTMPTCRQEYWLMR
jgi:hypothetical protein